jgi:hypothetical protein
VSAPGVAGALNPGTKWAVIGSLGLVLIGAALIAVLAVSGQLNTAMPSVTVIIGLIVTAVTGMTATAFARQASHDIRNGVVLEKAALGARQALDETGLTAVADKASDANALAMRALAELLDRNTVATETNTATHTGQHTREEGI